MSGVIKAADAEELLLFCSAMHKAGITRKQAHIVAMVAMRSLMNGLSPEAQSQISKPVLSLAQELARACGERLLLWLEDTRLGNDPALIKAMAVANGYH